MGTKRKRTTITVRIKTLTGKEIVLDVAPDAHGCYPEGYYPTLKGGCGMLKFLHRFQEKYKWEASFTYDLLNE